MYICPCIGRSVVVEMISETVNSWDSVTCLVCMYVCKDIYVRADDLTA